MTEKEEEEEEVEVIGLRRSTANTCNRKSEKRQNEKKNYHKS